MSEVTKKQMNVTCKTLEGQDRVIRFIASNENKDRDGDIIEIAGWEVSEYMDNPVFLDFHKWGRPPLGKTIDVQINHADREMIMDVKFPTIEELSSDPANPAEHAKYADMIYNMYKSGLMNTVSVGFQPKEYEPIDKEAPWAGFRFTKQTLLELSAVSIPANPQAVQVLRGKGFSQEDIEKLMKDQEPEPGTKDIAENSKLGDNKGVEESFDIKTALSEAVDTIVGAIEGKKSQEPVADPEPAQNVADKDEVVITII